MDTNAEMDLAGVKSQRATIMVLSASEKERTSAAASEDIPATAITHNGAVEAIAQVESKEATMTVNNGFTVNDQIDMKRMGKKQEFRRNFRFLTSVGFTCAVMGTYEILLTSNTQALLAGGSAGLFWSLCWAYLGQMFIVLSLAEMSAMAPTAGGQYHWVSEFAPDSYQKLLSYLSGWFATIAWQSIVALDCYLVGLVIQALISINDESYVPTRWQATLIIWAVVIAFGLYNAFGARTLPALEAIFVTGHFLAFFPIIITILVLAPKRSAREVFLVFSENGSGWPSVAWATLVGQVSAMFAVLGSDSVAHMSEEVEDAGLVVPRAMIWSFLINVPPTFGMIISYLFCMISVADAVADPSGFPFIYVFRQAVRTPGGTTGLTVVILILLSLITVSSFTSTSRQTFAFARDKGLPFSGWLGKVHPKWQVPIPSIIFTCLFTMLMSLINIGSTAAFNALLSLSTVALMATYVVSISCVLHKRIKGGQLPPARWSLGRFGTPTNVCALFYAVWSFFWSVWPNTYEPNAVTMNWAPVLFVGLIGIGTVLYIVHARKIYEGPVSKVEKTL